MANEIEVKILGINVEKLKKSLARNQASLISPMEKQIRYIFDIDANDKSKWIRLRTSGGKTTLTVKVIRDDRIDGTEEFEVTVSDIKTTLKILELMGFSLKSYQENYRITYSLDGAELSIDFWPQLKPYLEIEANDKAKIREIIKKLGLSEYKQTSANTIKLYDAQGIDLNIIKELKFTNEEEGGYSSGRNC